MVMEQKMQEQMEGAEYAEAIQYDDGYYTEENLFIFLCPRCKAIPRIKIIATNGRVYAQIKCSLCEKTIRGEQLSQSSPFAVELSAIKKWNKMVQGILLGIKL